jgi:hypothetical protein
LTIRTDKILLQFEIVPTLATTKFRPFSPLLPHRNDNSDPNWLAGPPIPNAFQNLHLACLHLDLFGIVFSHADDGNSFNLWNSSV